VPALEQSLALSISAMHNRGPDSAGQISWTARDGQGWSSVMGSTRLAVLDLSPAGRQPMSTPDDRLSLVYNGEITNYIELRDELARAGMPFSSGSDTEVLLNAWAAWGSDSLLRLEGMYAFAILDRSAQTLTLCRDAFGIKPLFYRVIPGQGLAFGSEIASILPLIPSPPRLDWSTAASYLSAGAYDDSAATFIDGIRQLAPGGSIVADLSAGQVRTDLPARWWPSIRTDDSITARQAVDGVRSLFLESVHRNLRADVPVGIALSGGIDSSAIVGAVRMLEPDYPLRVFSFISSDAATDESPWIELVNGQAKAQAWAVTPTAEELAADLDDLVLAQGEPFGSTSIYAQYRVFRLMREAGVVVSLDGQGGDEVFAGYHGYVGQRTRSLIETGDVLGAARFMRNWSTWPGRGLTKGIARTGAEFAPAWAVSGVVRRRPGSVPDGVDIAALHARGLGWDWPMHPASREGRRGVRVKAELRASLTERGLQALLRHGDRNSMRFSVESRVPFLDRALVDFVLALPERMLVDERGTTKAVLRAALRGIVPDPILDRRDKIGFETPETSWIDAQRPSFAQLVALAPEIGFLDKDAILSGIDPARRSRGSGVRPIPPRMTWRVFNLYRWVSLLGIDAG
jgi:asparagine synthase (glutamine-hydrolysing)